MPKKLNKSMTVDQFDKGYWYALEIKEFARQIGIPNAGKLRKDELELLIRHYLATGEVKASSRIRTSKQGTKDVELGLRLTLPVINYSDKKETKDFILNEVRKIDPDLKRRSGAQYRLNRWREDQINSGVKITYGDLVKQFVKLNRPDEKYSRIQSTRYIYFLSDFLAAEKGAARQDALDAWHQLKALDIPKTYQAWKKQAWQDSSK